MSNSAGRRFLITVVAGVLLLTACSASQETASSPSSPASAGDPSTDKLAQILARGTLVLSTDPVYPPQSYAVKGAERAPDTKCSPDEMTADEITGYDAETGKLVAGALGVEPCFVVPDWTQITSGNWSDRWDISYGSGSINEDRMERLWMTQPYYAVPNVYFVRDDSKFQTPDDLAGATIGACASCSHEFYLRGELAIPGVDIVVNVDDPDIALVKAESNGLEAVAKGKMDAFLAAAPVGQALIDEGLPLRALDEVAFIYYPSGFVDKSSGLDSAAFVAQVNEIIAEAQADGSLQALSEEFFGTDYASQSAEFDIDSIDQGEIS